MGEGSLYGWSLNLTRLKLTHKENMFLFVCSETVVSKLVKLETSCTVILPPIVSVLCIKLITCELFPTNKLEVGILLDDLPWTS